MSINLWKQGAPFLIALAPLAIAILALIAGSRWLILFYLSYRGHRRLCRLELKADYLPSISILVPAYNEAENIETAIESLLTLDYPDYEILVIDDGSTDETLKLSRPFAGDYGNCSVHVFHKPNGGKWSALNYGFHHAQSELLLCVDADSRLSLDSLRLMVDHMSDPNVAAVAGQVRVRNRDRLLTRLQGLEYIMANGSLRMAQADSGSVLVVPGYSAGFEKVLLSKVETVQGLRIQGCGLGYKHIHI